MLHRLAIAEDCDRAGGTHAGIQRDERRPAEEYDEEQDRDHQPGADFRARVSGFAVHWLQCDDFAHAAFSAAFGSSQAGDDLGRRTDHLRTALFEHQQPVGRCEHSAAVRDDDDRRSARPRLGDRPQQRLLAVLVEEGVGFVEHEQARVAIQRPSQRHALRLAGRQPRAHQAERRVIALAAAGG